MTAFNVQADITMIHQKDYALKLMEVVGLGMKPTVTALVVTQDMYVDQPIGYASLSNHL